MLCYPPRAPGVDGDGATDRSHEFVLVHRKVRERIDVAATLAVLEALREAGFAFDVFGSFATWQADPRAREPADLDLRVPRDEAQLARMLDWLRVRGFALTLWGDPVIAPPDLATLDRHGYLRAERIDRAGALVRIDLVPVADDAAPRA